MWTLRDIYHMFNKQAEEEWRKRKLMELMRNRQPQPQSLVDVFQNKHNQINSVLEQQQKQYGTPSVEQMYNYDRQYKGLL